MFEKAYEARKQHNEEIAKLNAAATASFAMVPAVSQVAKPMSKAFKPSTKKSPSVHVSTASISSDDSNEDTEYKPDNNGMECNFPWPNGTIEFEVPKHHQEKDGKPYIGYALCHLSTDKMKNGDEKRRYFCLGVFACSVNDCPFVARPMHPLRKKMNAVPRPPKITCPRHHDKSLDWIACTGGNPAALKQPLLDPPCILVTTKQMNGTMMMKHFGEHNHPQPPLTKLSPHALRDFEAIV